MKTKKSLLTLVLVLALSVSAFCQNDASSISLGGGYVEDGYGINGTYSYHLNKRTYAQFSVLASFAVDKESAYEIPYNIFTLQGGVMFELWEEPNFKKHKISVGGGALLGYEVFKNELENGAVIDGKSKLVYGAFATIEYELYLSNEFALMFKVNEFYHVNSDLGQFYLYAGCGIRYYLF